MIDDSSVLAVVPARSGSKGIPNKNIKEYRDKPLLVHALSYAEKNLRNGCIVLSTDSDRYLDVARDYGFDLSAKFLRPSALAGDEVQDHPVALHALSESERLFSRTFDYVAWLRPTSPIRPPGLIQTCLKLLSEDHQATSIRAVRPVVEHPYRTWYEHGSGEISGIIHEVPEPFNLPRQLLPSKYWFQSGEIEMVTAETLRGGSMSGGYVLPLKLFERNPDIDTAEDLAY